MASPRTCSRSDTRPRSWPAASSPMLFRSPSRNGRSSCPALSGLLGEILRPDQLRAGRKLELDQTQASTVLNHANQCAACAPQVDEARDFSRWALGPGLVNLAKDEEGRRRAIIALLDRAG